MISQFEVNKVGRACGLRQPRTVCRVPGRGCVPCSRESVGLSKAPRAREERLPNIGVAAPLTCRVRSCGMKLSLAGEIGGSNACLAPAGHRCVASRWCGVSA